MLSGPPRRAVRSALDALGLLEFARRSLHRSSPSTTNDDAKPEISAAPAVTIDSYQSKLAEERRTFRDNVQVHDLPQIYHYWSNKYLLPAHKPFGFTCPDSFFRLHVVKQLERAGPATVRVLSVGAGNCDTEVRLATTLKSAGHDNFVIECLDINEDMLERGRQLAFTEQVGAQILLTCADFNYWRPDHQYDVVIANQSLHHVVELESLFSLIKRILNADGVFLTSDMIGRNGHMRWPEALEIVDQFWQELPESYRYNLQLRRQEERFQNWDCSQSGFEGIRAQDVLPLLVQHFYFEDFFAFANVIDPFIDRSFGHHFDPHNDVDLNFIDRVHAADEDAMKSGKIKPTHMLAAMRITPCAVTRHIPPLTPEFSVRPT
jgi:SAM-dependent methyltransferase